MSVTCMVLLGHVCVSAHACECERVCDSASVRPCAPVCVGVSVLSARTSLMTRNWLRGASSGITRQACLLLLIRSRLSGHMRMSYDEA